MKKSNSIFLLLGMAALALPLAGCTTNKGGNNTTPDTPIVSEDVADQKIRDIYNKAVENGFEGTYEEWLATIKGEKGDTGPQGPAGEKGDKGETGPAGPQGPAGQNGADGKDGAPGAKGDKGEPGADGKDGAPGKDGVDGQDGAPGAKGEKGDKGDTGAKGDKGDKGDTGAAGQNGADGADGADGTGVRTGTGAPAAELGIVGDVYIDKATWDVYEKGAEGWAKVGNIKGTDGADGKDGADGQDYVRAKHTVKFDTLGGTVVADQTVLHGEKATRPEDPVRKGYTFNDWTYQNERWSFPGYVVTEDMTITAAYTANEYTVTFDAGTKGTLPEGVAETLKVTYDSTVTLPVPTKKAYAFAGWYEGETLVSDGAWKIDHNVTLTAKYTANDYNVVFDFNDGVTPNEVVVANAETKNYVSVLAKKPVRAGFTFLGWYKEDGTKETGNYYAKDEGKGVVYTAHWSMNAASFTGTAKDGKAIEISFTQDGKVDVIYDSTFSIPSDYGAPDELSMSSTANKGLTYELKGNQIIIKGVKYDYAAGYDTGTGTTTLTLTMNEAGNLVVAKSFQIGSYYTVGPETVLATDTVIARKADPNADPWAVADAVYEYNGDKLEISGGKLILSGNLAMNEFDSSSAKYKYTANTITVTYSQSDWVNETVNDYKVTFSVAADLSTITATSNLDNTGMGAPYIAKGTVFTRVSGPTR